jgi:hypothetical protein
MHRIAQSAVGALRALLAAGAAPAFAARCQLASNRHGVKHIVYIQFDNVHGQHRVREHHARHRQRLRFEFAGAQREPRQPHLAVADFEGTSTARREAGFAAARHMPPPTSFKASRAAIMASRPSAATSLAPALNHSSSIIIKRHQRWPGSAPGPLASSPERSSSPAQFRAGLVHLDAAVRPKWIRQSDGLIEQGELSRRVLDALRRAGEPIRAPGVVWAVMVAKALDPADLQSFVRVTDGVEGHGTSGFLPLGIKGSFRKIRHDLGA